MQASSGIGNVISTMEEISSGAAVCTTDMNVFGISIGSFYDDPEGMVQYNSYLSLNFDEFNRNSR